MIVGRVLKHLLVAMTAAIVVASGAAASTSTPDQRLADSLVVRKAEGPTYWINWKPRGGALLGCVGRAPAATASSRAIVGGPNTGVDSLARVFPDRRQAHLYYRHALVRVARCMRSWLAAKHPNRIWDAQPLSLGRYGRQSGAWRLRFIDDAIKYSRKTLDWAVVDTGRAVLVDVFWIGWYDARWRDIGVAGGPAVVVERRMLTNAIHRAATARNPS